MNRSLLTPTIAHAAAVIAVALCAPVIVAQSSSVIDWEAFPLRTYDGRSHDVHLGRIQVLESRARPDGPTVTLAFLRLPTTSPAPGSPIVFLMGGPGIPASVMAPIPPYWALFDSLRAIADVLLLDQRGLGLSSPRLDCPAGQPPDSNFLTSHAAFVAAYRRIVGNCAAHFRAQGVDPLAYTDAAIADDVDDIRAAIGAERVNLLAFSYGSRLAMTFARRYHARVDRIIIQAPADEQTMYRSSLHYDSVLAAVEQAATEDSASASFAADLLRRTRELLDRAATRPVMVRIRTGPSDSVEIAVGREALAGIITGRIADPRIPALIATLEQDDDSILRMWVQTMYDDLAGGAGSLMARAITCSQLPSPRRVSIVDEAAARSMFGPAFDNFSVSAGFCSVLGEFPDDTTERSDHVLDRPVLLIVGSRDDRSPESNVEHLRAELSDATVLHVENGGHELFPYPRVQRSVVGFFRGAQLPEQALRVDLPRFLSIEDARQPPRRPGR